MSRTYIEQMAQLDVQQKLAILADAAKYDASCASSGSTKRDSRGGKGIGSTAPGMGICHAYAPDGRCISLLKILLTNSCILTAIIASITACRWWLQQELALIRPPLVVALGATAARSLFGRAVTITSLRGKAHKLEGGTEAWVTVHPSFLLRVRDDKEAEYAKFVDDLRRIGQRLEAVANV